MAVASGARSLDKRAPKNKSCRLCSRQCAPPKLPSFVAELLGLGPGPPGLLGGWPEARREERPAGEAVLQPRSEQEVQEIVRKWLQCSHPRAYEYFRSGGEDALLRELSEIARSIDRSSDPVLASASQCVIWRGGQRAGEAVIEANESGMLEDTTTTTFVNRTLAFIFATDQSLARRLACLSDGPLAMSCGNQLCVNMSHITIATIDSSGP